MTDTIQKWKINLAKKERLAAIQRGDIAVRTKPYYVTLDRGLSLGYRLNRHGGGVWVARWANGDGNNSTETLGAADDEAKADGVNVLDYGQARAKAHKVAKGEAGATSVIVKGGARTTVADAAQAYAIELTTTKGSLANWRQFCAAFKNGKGKKANMLPLWDKAVADLTVEDMTKLREAMLLRGCSKSTVNRTGTVVRAALTLAANADKRITNRDAWMVGFAELKGAAKGRDECILLRPEMSSAIIQAAYQDGGGFPELGEKLHTLAETGARESQIMRVRCRDLEATVLMVPPSRKGNKDDRQMEDLPSIQIEISEDLAARLALLCAGKSANDLLFTPKDHLSGAFKEVAAHVGADSAAIPLSFRHSSIVRMLRAGEDLMTISKLHDTSPLYIKNNYAKYILDETAKRAFSTRPNFMAPVAGNVVSIRKTKVS